MRKERIQLLQKFISENPEDPFNKYALALEFIADGCPDEAISLIETLLTKHSDYLPTYYQAAHFYWAQNDMEKADQVFQDGIHLAIKTNDTKALSELKSSYQNFTIEWDD